MASPVQNEIEELKNDLNSVVGNILAYGRYKDFINEPDTEKEESLIKN